MHVLAVHCTGDRWAVRWTLVVWGKKNAENKGFGRGGEIRTHDPLRPRHRNVPTRAVHKPHVNKELRYERLHRRTANVARIVAVRFLKIQQARLVPQLLRRGRFTISNQPDLIKWARRRTVILNRDANAHRLLPSVFFRYLCG